MNSESYLGLGPDKEHALFGASNWHWTNKSSDEIRAYITNKQAAAMGTALHNAAAMNIKLGLKMPKNEKTFNRYVNDAIGYGMDVEKKLFFSKYCFGTADAISFSRGLLRIHDLKTGVTPVHIEQLMIYAAFWCHQNMVDPHSIRIELRIYQNNEIMVEYPDPDKIKAIIDKAAAATLLATEVLEG